MRGPFSTPITPLPGSLFHADPQIKLPDDHAKVRKYTHGREMKAMAIVPRRYIQERTQRLSMFENHPLKHTASMVGAIKSAIANAKIMEVKRDKMAENFSFHGEGYRLLDPG